MEQDAVGQELELKCPVVEQGEIAGQEAAVLVADPIPVGVRFHFGAHLQFAAARRRFGERDPVTDAAVQIARADIERRP
ncbi:unnamed protein product [Leptidea sinapis]|uniref:Uncharacterized protein n=1 Tax=Leptidea sinapis TaxID=189913 RepID=A0A5E4QJ22_9NEOP|nr:unnamed protein product [Leptidea sinapis]